VGRFEWKGIDMNAMEAAWRRIQDERGLHDVPLVDGRVRVTPEQRERLGFSSADTPTIPKAIQALDKAAAADRPVVETDLSDYFTIAVEVI
jgi:hypothetical protein